MEIATDPAKIKILSMGRRWGKTTLGGVLICQILRYSGRAAWVAPTYKNARPLWRWLRQALRQDIAAKRVQLRESAKTVETPRGGFVGIYSGDNIDSIRSEAFHLVVVDEAARLKEDDWEAAILPTLADYNGDAVLISTPRRRNWFWREWLAGQGGDARQRSWSAPSSDNPLPNIRAAAENARLRVSDRTYRQEWLAEFVDDSGAVFRRILDAVADCWQDEPQPGADYVVGIDWGRSEDYTVATVVEASSGAVVHIDRYTQIDYALQIQRIVALIERFRPSSVLAESNSMGAPLIEALRQRGAPVTPFATTNSSKSVLVDALALAFEQGAIRLPHYEPLIHELQEFSVSRLPSGLFRYAAPDGAHDDCVISLALAWHARGTAAPLLLWGG